MWGLDDNLLRTMRWCKSQVLVVRRVVGRSLSTCREVTLGLDDDTLCLCCDLVSSGIIKFCVK